MGECGSGGGCSGCGDEHGEHEEGGGCGPKASTPFSDLGGGLKFFQLHAEKQAGNGHAHGNGDDHGNGIVKVPANATKSSPSPLTHNNMGFRRRTPPFRVFFTWDITYVCNYRCSYCIIFESPQWDSYLSKKHRAPIPAERWMEIWDGIYDKYGSAHIHCSGGEPFYYPRFIDIVEHMTKKHTMETDTNLSFDVDKFIGRINPAAFRFSPSFHPEFTDIEAYMEKCRKLKAAGYDVEGVNFIAWPPHVPLMRGFKQRFLELGITFTVIPFRGRFNGKDYPDAFSIEDRKLINEASGNKVLTEEYGSWYKGANQGEENTTHKAANCRAGQMYAKIHPNGNALRCCFIDDRGTVGNLIDGSFKLYDDPKLCEFPACTCWKSMIVGEEDRWLRHWVGVKVGK
jgi:MoaA/NifB/PqqE/SkfB family radical SAM enzyme